MADHNDHVPDPAVPAPNVPRPSEPGQSPIPDEEQYHDRGEDDEPYTDPEHARRLAAVRTELMRRSMPKCEPEE